MPLGPLWATWWLDVAATVPEEWDGERVDLLLVTHSEATCGSTARRCRVWSRAREFQRPDAC